MHRNSLFIAALAVSSVSVVSSAGAMTSSSFAAVTNVTFTLLDLDPLDSISPSATFIIDPTGVNSGVGSNIGGVSCTVYCAHSDSLFYPLSDGYAGVGYSMSSSVGSNFLQAGAIAHLSFDSGYYMAAAGVNVTDPGPIPGDGGVLLAPRTGLRVEADISLSAHASNAPSGFAPFYRPSAGVVLTDNPEQGVFLENWGELTTRSSLTWLNNSNIEQLGYFYAYANVSGSDFALPVPDLSSRGAMVVGLLVLWYALRAKCGLTLRSSRRATAGRVSPA